MANKRDLDKSKYQVIFIITGKDYCLNILSRLIGQYARFVPDLPGKGLNWP